MIKNGEQTQNPAPKQEVLQEFDDFHLHMRQKYVKGSKLKAKGVKSKVKAEDKRHSINRGL
jgi:hypothetical protein